MVEYIVIEAVSRKEVPLIVDGKKRPVLADSFGTENQDAVVAQGIGFKSLRDGAIDTTTVSGELVFNLFAALAQFERELIRERTRAGLKAARARGRNGGRKPIHFNDPKVRMAKKMHADKSMSVNDICSTLNISRATLYRYLKM